MDETNLEKPSQGGTERGAEASVNLERRSKVRDLYGVRVSAQCALCWSPSSAVQCRAVQASALRRGAECDVDAIVTAQGLGNTQNQKIVSEAVRPRRAFRVEIPAPSPARLT